MKYYELLNECKKYPKEYEACLFIIIEVSKFSKSELYLSLNKEIDAKIYTEIRRLLTLYLEKNIPVQYLLGYTYFYGSKINVSPDVLIPRFETEEVVDKAIAIIRERKLKKIVDVGTGSGCIAIAIKKAIPEVEMMAIDISPEALKVAKNNAKLNQVEIEFRENDLLTNINETFDMVISNPPYISRDEEVMDLVYDNEPHLALFSDNNGLYHYEAILKQARINSNGAIVFEIAYNKGQEMIKLASLYYQDVQILKDIHNNDRIMIIQGDKK